MECVNIKGRKFTIVPVRVQESTPNKNIDVPPNCNGWVVENYGTVTARLNNKPVLPPPGPGLSGEKYGVGGNPGDIFTGQIQVTFDAAPGGDVWLTFYVYQL